MTKCLGILREPQHSPGREQDDALILKTVFAELERFGFIARLIPPEMFESEETSAWDVILPMCESYPQLKRMETAQHSFSGNSMPQPLFMNTPAAILRCYRTSMSSILMDAIPGHFPPSETRRVQDGVLTPPARFSAPEGWWIKRGDVHNTCDADVVRLRGWKELSSILNDFQSREILHFVVQPHLPGDLIKFYGVGPGRWFTWFYHGPSNIRRHPFDSERLQEIAARAASAIGLEIFGGDAIVSPEGNLHLIDINSWPSFARVRNEAAQQIAAHTRARLSDGKDLRVPGVSRPRALKRRQ